MPCQRRIDPYQPTWTDIAVGLVHECLIGVSRLYTRWTEDWLDDDIYPLPFNLLIKAKRNTTRSEYLAMLHARRLGVCAPRTFSFGVWRGRLSILMKRVRGHELSQVSGTLEPHHWDKLGHQFERQFRLMRSVPVPVRDRPVSDFAGGRPVSYLIPPEIKGPWRSEGDLLGAFAAFCQCEENAEQIAHFQEIATRPHDIVFTHGDLYAHNVIVDENYDLLAIIDWGTAGWMPEWWEFGVSMRWNLTGWNKAMSIAGGSAYGWERERHRSLRLLTSSAVAWMD